MKYKFLLASILITFISCNKIRENRSYPNDYDFKNWLELKTEVKTISYSNGGIWNDSQKISVVPNIIISSKIMASNYKINKYVGEINFVTNDIVFSKPVYLEANQRLKITQPRFWINFNANEYYIRYGETIYSGNSSSNRDTLVMMAIVPKIPEGFNARNGFEPK